MNFVRLHTQGNLHHGPIVFDLHRAFIPSDIETTETSNVNRRRAMSPKGPDTTTTNVPVQCQIIQIDTRTGIGTAAGTVIASANVNEEMTGIETVTEVIAQGRVICGEVNRTDHQDQEMIIAVDRCRYVDRPTHQAHNQPQTVRRR